MTLGVKLIYLNTYAKFGKVESTPMLKALGYGRNDIVKILAPFIGNANAQLYPDVDSPIQNAIFFKNPEAINWLAHF